MLVPGRSVLHNRVAIHNASIGSAGEAAGHRRAAPRYVPRETALGFIEGAFPKLLREGSLPLGNIGQAATGLRSSARSDRHERSWVVVGAACGPEIPGTTPAA